MKRGQVFPFALIDDRSQLQSISHKRSVSMEINFRVSQGGHNIPDDVIRRRFAAGLNQFEKTYKPIVNAWFLYNNQHRPPILLSEGVNP